MSTRPQKTWRMSYWNTNSSEAEAHISLLADPGEMRFGVGGKSFLSVKEDSFTMSGGSPSRINVQGLGFHYAGLLKDVQFPFSLIPGAPRQRVVVPFREQLPTIQQVAVIATSMAGF